MTRPRHGAIHSCFCAVVGGKALKGYELAGRRIRVAANDAGAIFLGKGCRDTLRGRETWLRCERTCVPVKEAKFKGTDVGLNQNTYA
jgi:hypothetical protein